MVTWIRALQHDVSAHTTDVAHDEVFAWAFGQHIVNCSSMAARAWLLWDVLITFEEEVEIVWQMKWSFIKFLYFFIRYIGISLQAISLWFAESTQSPEKTISEHDSRAWRVYQAMVVCFLTVALEYTLLLRVYALYSRHRLLRRMLRGLFYAVVAALFVSRAISMQYGKYIYGAASAVFQLSLFFLTIGKFVQAVKAGWSTTPIITLLMRDGTWSFFVLIGFTFLYLMVLNFTHPSFSNLLFDWGTSIHSFIGYRNLLNIFKLSSQSQVDTVIPTRSSVLLSTNLITAQDTLTLEEYERQMGLMVRND